MNDDELKYKDIIDSLRQLKKINALTNFESNLMRKINTTQKQKSLWEIIFSPVRLIPSAALVATAMILIFVMKNNSTKPEDPFSTEPRMREDLPVNGLRITFPEELVDMPDKKEEVDKKPLTETKPLQESDVSLNEFEMVDSQFSSKEGGLTITPAVDETDVFSVSTEKAESSIISKSNLNFRQIESTDSSREEVMKLKENVNKILKTGKKAIRKSD